jgi:hypothetical protein
MQTPIGSRRPLDSQQSTKNQERSSTFCFLLSAFLARHLRLIQNEEQSTKNKKRSSCVLPWVVLDPTLAAETWHWQPTTPVESILEEIASFADANPNWIATSA